MYLLSKYRGKDVRIKLTREAYLVDRLKVKILLNTNVIGLERINIITLKGYIYIGSCDTTIEIDFRLRSRGVTIKPVVVNK